MVGTDGKWTSARARNARRMRAGLALATLVVAVLAVSGCVFYEADIRIATDGKVLVRERVQIDPVWKEEIRDSLQAAEKVLLRYADEARQRGGKVLRLDADSALVEFRYPSLAAFARAWPDSGDEGQQYDRSLFRQRQEDGHRVDELILWRMSPPDRSKETQTRRYPVLAFRVTPPAPPLRHNAHFVQGGTYGWRFTDQMTAPDSVLIVWPATEK